MPTVRLLTPADATAYTLIRREMLADAPWSFIRSPEDDPGCNADGLAAQIERSNAGPTGRYAICGAFDAAPPGPRLIAVAGIARAEQIKASHRATVWGVYVTPAHRRKGLARAVITGAIDAARAWPAAAPFPPIDSIALAVSENAPGARALYQSMGFTAWGTEPDTVRINGAKPGYAETHMLMRL